MEGDSVNGKSTLTQPIRVLNVYARHRVRCAGLPHPTYRTLPYPTNRSQINCADAR